MGNNSFIAPSTPLDRRHLGKYEVLCRLSTGGMSAIYLAHQTGLAGFKKLVVLKTILPDIGGEEDFVGMFLEEARITAVFNHPNIAQVFELDTDEGQLFMAMEFVQGCTLVEMARACRQAKEAIPLGLTLAATRDTALALHYAHNFTDARGRKQIVIHRDVAEKNIMVTYEGVTKLLDFGIAKALGRSGRTSIGMVKGTSGYMSPEQIRGEPLDPRSDIFALGVVMHECLTGLRLFHGKTPEEGMMAALREEVQPPSKWNKEVNAELDAVVLKALQRDREKRFNTALEFARAIEKAAPGLIWHPEQLGEVVTRHFSERRAETRRLLESAEFGAETTGEVRVENVLAKVRAGALTTANPAAEPARKPSLISAPRAVMPRDEPEMTRPGVMPSELKNPPPPSSTSEGTSPARPRALRGPTSSPSVVTAASPAIARPFSYDEDDDDAGDKTIPAAALPDEIRNLRAQFAANRKPASDKSPALSPPVRDPELTPAANNPPAPIANPVLPPRTITGETVSITHKGNPMDWEDDDDGAKTAIAKPGELPGVLRGARRPPPSPVPFSAASVEQPMSSPSLPQVDSFDEVARVRPRRTGLILALLVLAMLAVGGLLVLLDIVPLPRLPGGGRKVGALVATQGSRPG
ncbi:MAG: protein kinase [Archangium sp.]|nr:protein kinase [Archangium sp.]MDP3573626.1 protein kinase [Archangium sp.]